MPIKIGLVGCGAIGAEIAKAVDSGALDANLVAVCDHNPKTAVELIDSLQHKPARVKLEELVALSDVVVEAASQKAVPAIARATLEKGKKLMIMSVGAFANEELFAEVKALAKEHGSRVYLPSGAISGLDGLKSASIGTIRSVTLTTTKNPGGLKGAPCARALCRVPCALCGPALVLGLPCALCLGSLRCSACTVSLALSCWAGRDLHRAGGCLSPSSLPTPSLVPS